LLIYGSHCEIYILYNIKQDIIFYRCMEALPYWRGVGNAAA